MRGWTSFLVAPASLCVFVAIGSVTAQVPSSGRETRPGCGAFVIRYPERLGAMAEAVETFLCESAEEIASSLGCDSIDTITVVIAADFEAYRMLSHGSLPRWSAAYSDTRTQLLGLDARSVARMNRPIRIVIRHELSHLLLAQRVGGVYCPLWFMEGLAVLQSREWDFLDQWRLSGELARRDLPYLEELEGPFPEDAEDAAFAYAVSFLAVQELFGQHPGGLARFTASLHDIGDFDEAFEATFGESPADFSERLHPLMEKRYKNLAALMRTAPYWSIATLLFLLAFAVKRRRNRRIIEEWRRREGVEP